MKKRSIKKAIFTLNVNNKSNENSQEFSSSVLDAQDENSNSNINAEDLIETVRNSIFNFYIQIFHHHHFSIKLLFYN